MSQIHALYHVVFAVGMIWISHLRLLTAILNLVLGLRTSTMIGKSTVKIRKSSMHALRRVEFVLNLLGHTFVKMSRASHLQPRTDHQKTVIGFRFSILKGKNIVTWKKWKKRAPILVEGALIKRKKNSTKKRRLEIQHVYARKNEKNLSVFL